MKLFLDTSALVKLYHTEADSHLIENLFVKNKITTVFLSALTKIEFTSSVWKKWRGKELTELQAKVLVESFENDYHKYLFVALDGKSVSQAINLLNKYGPQGLRTLDSLQLAAAVSLRTTVTLFKSADKLLDSFLAAENLSTT